MCGLAASLCAVLTLTIRACAVLSLNHGRGVSVRGVPPWRCPRALRASLVAAVRLLTLRTVWMLGAGPKIIGSFRKVAADGDFGGGDLFAAFKGQHGSTAARQHGSTATRQHALLAAPLHPSSFAEL